MLRGHPGGRIRGAPGNTDPLRTPGFNGMATKYCALCNRPVEARRHIGLGTVILAFVTGGLWLVAIPFYAKRCSICKSAAVSDAPPASAAVVQGTPLARRLEELEQRLALAERELESANVELDRLRAEQDFYRQLLDDPGRRRGGQPGS